MDGWVSGRRGQILASVVAVVLLPLGPGLLAQLGATPGASRPVPPTLRVEMSALLDGQPDDGLTRLVARLSGEAGPVAPAAAADEPAGPDAGNTAEDALIWLNDDANDAHLSLEGLSPADRALLLQLQGSGAGGLPRPVAPSVGAGAPAAAEEVIAALAAVDGIESVTPAGEGFVAIATDLAAERVAALPGVADVAPDPLRAVTVDHTADQWALANPAAPGSDIRWEEASTRADGAGVVVAVIDTGIDTTHPDLAGQLWHNAGETCGNGVDDDANGYTDDCTGWDFVGSDGGVHDAGGADLHGTHVAGTIAAAADGEGTTGVAPGARIMPLKVVHTGSTTSSRVAAAIDYAVRNGADVINMSLGGPGISPAESAALDRASAAGVVVVTAMGNDGLDVTASPIYPAAYDRPNIIAVSASDAADAHAAYANYSGTLADLHAPGTQILSTAPGGGVGYLTGTSMAAPHVAGVAALVVQRGATGSAVQQTVIDTAADRAGLAGRTVSGGRLDAAAAVGIPSRDLAAGGIAVEFASMHDARPGQPDVASITVTGSSSELVSGQVKVQGRVGMVHEGRVYGVTDLTLTVGPRQARTNYAAQVALANHNSGDEQTVIPLEWTLPAGTYVMAVEFVSPSDPTVALAAPQMTVFTVADARPGAPSGDAPGAGSGGGGVGGDDGTVGGDPSVGGDAGTGGVGGGTVPLPDGSGDSGTVPSTGSGGDGSTGGGGPAVGGPQPIVPVPGDGGVIPADPAEYAGADGQGTPGGSGGEPSAPAPAAPGAPTGAAPAPPAAVADPVAPAPEAPVPAHVEPAPAVPAPAGPAAPAEPVQEEPVGEPAVEVPVASTGSGHVSPPVGPREGGLLAQVTVEEGIPDGAYIHFGGRNASILTAGTGQATVTVPAHAPGVVDVEVIARDGTRIVLPGAFTYLEDDGSVPTGSTPPEAPGAGTGGAGSVDGDSTDGSGSDGSDGGTDGTGSDGGTGGDGSGTGGDSGSDDPGVDPDPGLDTGGDGVSGPGAGDGRGGNGGRAGGLPAVPGQPSTPVTTITVSGLSLAVPDATSPLSRIPGSALATVCAQEVCAGRVI